MDWGNWGKEVLTILDKVSMVLVAGGNPSRIDEPRRTQRVVKLGKVILHQAQ